MHHWKQLLPWGLLFGCKWNFDSQPSVWSPPQRLQSPTYSTKQCSLTLETAFLQPWMCDVLSFSMAYLSICFPTLIPAHPVFDYGGQRCNWWIYATWTQRRPHKPLLALLALSQSRHHLLSHFPQMSKKLDTWLYTSNSYDCLICEPIISTKSTFPALPSWGNICAFYQSILTFNQRGEDKPPKVLCWITYARILCFISLTIFIFRPTHLYSKQPSISTYSRIYL